MKGVRISADAERDLEELLSFISRDKPASAIGFVARIKSCCQTLAAMPQMGQCRDDLATGLRQFSVGSQVIFFRRVEPGIEVVRVLHGAQDASRHFP